MQERIELNAEEQAAFAEIQSKEAGVRTFCDQVIAQAEQKLGHIQQQHRAIWLKIAEDHGLDLKKCAYAVSDDGKSLVLKTVKYSDG